MICRILLVTLLGQWSLAVVYHRGRIQFLVIVVQVFSTELIVCAVKISFEFQLLRVILLLVLLLILILKFVHFK